MTGAAGDGQAAPVARPATPTQRLHEVTMAALARKPAEPESSVTIARNAKGDVQFEVTVRGLDVIACEQLAGEIADRLAEKYPRDAQANGGGKESGPAS